MTVLIYKQNPRSIGLHTSLQTRSRLYQLLDLLTIRSLEVLTAGRSLAGDGEYLNVSPAYI